MSPGACRWAWLWVGALLATAGCSGTATPPATEAPIAGAGASGEQPQLADDTVIDTAPRSADATAEHPALVVQTLDGETWDLATRRGRWVVVNYWATWCAPCLKEMPELSELDASEPDIEVIGLAYEDIDADTMRAFLEKLPVVYPVAILDLYAPPADFAAPVGLPLTYLIDPQGRVARRFLGQVTSEQIRAAIAQGAQAPAESAEAAEAATAI